MLVLLSNQLYAHTYVNMPDDPFMGMALRLPLPYAHDVVLQHTQAYA